MGYIKDIQIGTGAANLIEPVLYAETKGSTSAYTASIENFELVTGVVITLKIHTTNAANATLKINSGAAKNIKYKNDYIAANALSANRFYSFLYDGTYWQLIGELDTNTTYTAGTGIAITDNTIRNAGVREITTSSDSNGALKVNTNGTETAVFVKGIENGYLNIHPENTPILIPFIHNDIAHLLERGGSATLKLNGEDKTANYDLSAIFDGSGYYFSFDRNVTSTLNTIVLEITCHTSFRYGSTIYIDFGSVNWRATNIRIDVKNNNINNYTDDWTNKANITNNTSGHYACWIYHTAANPKNNGIEGSGSGFNQIRFTLSGFQTQLRIAQIGVYNYGSIGVRETYMSRGEDDPVFRNITPNTTNIYNLGSNDKKWANVYATTFTGNLTGTASRATGDADGNAIKTTYAKLASPTFTGTPKSVTPSSSSDGTMIATKEYVDNSFAANDAMIFKGTIGSSGANVTALPAIHNVGWTYRVITPGKYANIQCEMGDLIICITNGTVANDAHWTIAQTNIDGAVIGPTSSTTNHVALFSDTSGKVIKDSGVTLGTMATETATNYLKWQSTSITTANTIYDFGVYVKQGSADTSTTPSGNAYYNILNIPYRKASGNNKADYAWSIASSTASDNRLFFRTSNADTYGAWQEVAHAPVGTTTIGGTTQPVYMTKTGVITAGTTYAGGTAVTLNNASKAGSTASFYAPTAGGTANTQALVGNGATSAPKWVNISPSISITAGTSSAAPTINVTVLGQSGSAQAITIASTSVYGVTKLQDGISSTSTALAATANAAYTASRNSLHTLATTTKYYITGTTSSSTSTGGDSFDTGVYVTATAGELSAVKHSFNVSGTEKATMRYDNDIESIVFSFV